MGRVADLGNINHGEFVGDGGYTEVLANHGVLGFTGYIFVIFLSRATGLNYIKKIIVICCMVAMLPVGLQ